MSGQPPSAGTESVFAMLFPAPTATSGAPLPTHAAQQDLGGLLVNQVVDDAALSGGDSSSSGTVNTALCLLDPHCCAMYLLCVRACVAQSAFVW